MTEQKIEQKILVVPTNDLFGNKYFQGYKNNQEHDYFSRIIRFKEWQPRKEMETNPLFKQPIAYSIIFNPDSKKIFSYQRAKKDKDYDEKRLQGKWSWGIGGHIDVNDYTFNSKFNVIEHSMVRELNEETGLAPISKPILLGYINDDSNDVGKVHFGLLYLVETNMTELKPNPEITNDKFRSIDELEEIINNTNNEVEEWSKIALGQLKNQYDI